MKPRHVVAKQLLPEAGLPDPMGPPEVRGERRRRGSGI